MLLRVKGTTGRQLEIEIEYNCPIKEVKQKIADKQGIPSGVFFLVYGGKVLQDDKLLSDYPNITKDSLLQCVETTIGGLSNIF